MLWHLFDFLVNVAIQAPQDVVPLKILRLFRTLKLSNLVQTHTKSQLPEGPPNLTPELEAEQEPKEVIVAPSS